MLSCECLNILIEISESLTPNGLKLSMSAILSNAASFESVEFLKSVSLFVQQKKMPLQQKKKKVDFV